MARWRERNTRLQRAPTDAEWLQPAIDVLLSKATIAWFAGRDDLAHLCTSAAWALDNAVRENR
jgi:hypothetical protein